MIWTFGIGSALAGNVCDTGGPGDAGLVTRNGSTNYASVGAAIAASSDGDTITVCRGTYPVSQAVTKGITLRGVDGPDLTRLDGLGGASFAVLVLNAPGR